MTAKLLYNRTAPNAKALDAAWQQKTLNGRNSRDLLVYTALAISNSMIGLASVAGAEL